MESQINTTPITNEEKLCEALLYVLWKIENETTNILRLRQLVDFVMDSMKETNKAKAITRLEKVSKELGKLCNDHREMVYQINRLSLNIYGSGLDESGLEG